jgi:hypothetical protein
MELRMSPVAVQQHRGLHGMTCIDVGLATSRGTSIVTRKEWFGGM